MLDNGHNGGTIVAIRNSPTVSFVHPRGRARGLFSHSLGGLEFYPCGCEAAASIILWTRQGSFVTSIPHNLELLQQKTRTWIEHEVHTEIRYIQLGLECFHCINKHKLPQGVAGCCYVVLSLYQQRQNLEPIGKEVNGWMDGWVGKRLWRSFFATVTRQGDSISVTPQCAAFLPHSNHDNGFSYHLL